MADAGRLGLGERLASLAGRVGGRRGMPGGRRALSWLPFPGPRWTQARDLPLPPPPAGQTLDPRRVRVTYTSGATALELGYDAACASADGWHYDDPVAPTTIHLCGGACATVQRDPAAQVDVEFACTIVNPVLR